VRQSVSIMHRVTISRLETGLHQPLLAEACLIAEVFGLPVSAVRLASAANRCYPDFSGLFANFKKSLQSVLHSSDE